MYKYSTELILFLRNCNYFSFQQISDLFQQCPKFQNILKQVCLIMICDDHLYQYLSLYLGSTCPPLKENQLRLYNMRFGPFGRRTKLVLTAKNIP